MKEAGLEPISSSYIYRSTVNVKEGIDVPRIFVQGKYKLIGSDHKTDLETNFLCSDENTHKDDISFDNLHLQDNIESTSDTAADTKDFKPSEGCCENLT